MRQTYWLVALATILLGFIVSSCNGEDKEREEQAYATSAPTLPTPPAMITDPTARANYIMDNIWNDVNGIDTLTFKDWSEREQFLSNYLGISVVAEEGNRRSSVRRLFELSTPAMDSVILDMVDHYFGYAGSPLFDEETYIIVYDEAHKLGILSMAEEVRFKDRCDLFKRNQVGQQAEDFEYISPNGERHTLYDSFANSEVLLMFYNPDCSTCKHTLKFIAQNQVIQAEIANGLKMLCIYTDGDESAFREGLSVIPSFATAGIDKRGTILGESLYDLRAIPTIYLLDAERKVILKDTYPDDLVSYFVMRRNIQ